MKIEVPTVECYLCWFEKQNKISKKIPGIGPSNNLTSGFRIGSAKKKHS